MQGTWHYHYSPPNPATAYTWGYHYSPQYPCYPYYLCVWYMWYERACTANPYNPHHQHSPPDPHTPHNLNINHHRINETDGHDHHHCYNQTINDVMMMRVIVPVGPAGRVEGGGSNIRVVPKDWVVWVVGAVRVGREITFRGRVMLEPVVVPAPGPPS